MPFRQCFYLILMLITIFARSLLALPASVSLERLRENTWIQESHRLRLNAMGEQLLSNDSFIEALFREFGITEISASDREDFRRFTRFRIFNHDMAKSDLENAHGLTRLQGFDGRIATGSARQVRDEIIRRVNTSGQVLEHDIHHFVFEHDDLGRVLEGRQLEFRRLLQKVSERFELALDWHDRYAAATVAPNLEYGGKMAKGSEWAEKSIQILNEKLRKSRSPLEKLNLASEIKELIEQKKYCVFIESNFDLKAYGKITNKFSVRNYRDYRTVNFKIPYSQIARENGFQPEIPDSVKRFLPNETTNLTSKMGKHLVSQIMEKHPAAADMARVYPDVAVSAPHAPTNGILIAEHEILHYKPKSIFFTLAGNFAKMAGLLQASYGLYIFAKTGDLGQVFAEGVGISNLGESSAQISLGTPVQQRVFFTQNQSEQIRRLHENPDHRIWLENQFLKLPLYVQMQLICYDNSLADLFQLSCLQEVQCGSFTSDQSTEKYLGFSVSGNEKSETYYLNYTQDHLSPRWIPKSLSIFNRTQNVCSFDYTNRLVPVTKIGIGSSKDKGQKPQLTGEQKKYQPMNHWLLVNRRGFETACKKEDSKILHLSPIQKSSSITALEYLLNDVNQEYWLEQIQNEEPIPSEIAAKLKNAELQPSIQKELGANLR